MVQANAKINLALAVKHKRPDGYHEIESIFQEIDFGDIIELAPAEGIHFKSDMPQLNHERETNTCVMAARLLREEFKIPGIWINVKKNIPLGAGLGGGSSDAVAVLKGIAELYHLDITREKLWETALKIGSDVPFFLNGKTAHVSGRGEIVKPLSMTEEYTILLVLPGIRISTGDAYKNLKRDLTINDKKFKFIGLGIFAQNINTWKSLYYNDFETVVFKRYPALAGIKAALYKEGALYAAMSGSGSSVFGVFAKGAGAKIGLESFSDGFRCLYVRPVLNC